MKARSCILLFYAMFLLVTVSCERRDFEEKAKVEMGVVTDIMSREANAAANIIDLGEGIEDHGHCWAISPGPTIDSDKTSLGNAASTGNYVSKLTGLQAGVKYYVKAWVKSGYEVIYGKEVSFTTQDGKAVLSTTEITDITVHGAKGGGNVTSANGDTILLKGICWNRTENPTLENKYVHSTYGSGKERFTSQISGLQGNTKYYVNAFAINIVDNSYGSKINFEIKNGITTATATEATDIKATTATSGGNSTYDGVAANPLWNSVWDGKCENFGFDYSLYNAWDIDKFKLRKIRV